MNDRTPLLLTVGLAALLASAGAAGAAGRAEAAILDAQGKSVGTVELSETPQGVLLAGKLQGMPAGPHAFHIHAVGKCEPPFTSAQGHFNPGDRKHGLLVAEGAHAGDLPNLHVPASGALAFDMLAPGVSLATGVAGSLFDADGSALVVHAGADDYTSDPAGNAGARIACGVVRE